MPDKTPPRAGSTPMPRIVKTVRQARETAEETDDPLEPRQRSGEAHRGGSADRSAEQNARGRRSPDGDAEAARTGSPVDRTGRDTDRANFRDRRSEGSRTADPTAGHRTDSSNGRTADTGRSRTADPSGGERRREREQDAGRTRDADRTGGGGGGGRDGEDPRRTQPDRSADGTGSHHGREGGRSGSGRRRPPDPTGNDRDAGTGNGGRRSPRRARERTRNLRTFGPFVTRFEGRVSQVFGATQRLRPSLTPIVVGVVALAVAYALPYLLAWTSVIVLAGLALLWLRQRGWLRGGIRRQRGGNHPDAGLQVTSFRVQVYDDEGKAFRSLDCRLVQPGGVGSAPLVGNEVVVGHGHRLGRGVVEVDGLRIGDSGTRLRATHPRSSVAIALPTLALLGGAAGLVYAEWDVISTFDPRAVGTNVLQVLLILGVLVVLFRFFRSRLRL